VPEEEGRGESGEATAGEERGGQWAEPGVREPDLSGCGHSLAEMTGLPSGSFFCWQERMQPAFSRQVDTIV
jgi:hypothetical protein